VYISSLTNIENYDNSEKTSSIEKAKSDDFENLISSTKSINKTTTPKMEEKEIVVKSSTQSLYEDIISLLRTGFTVGELKAFEERLKEILKMKEDKESGKDISIKDIEAALKQLEMEILEAKKNITGQVIKKASENTTSSSNPSSDFDTTISNITNMLQEIKNSSNNTKQDSDDNEEYDRLKLLLKMS
jgi:hypothetical protein